MLAQAYVMHFLCVNFEWDFTFGLHVLMYHLHSFGMFESKIMDQFEYHKAYKKSGNQHLLWGVPEIFLDFRCQKRKIFDLVK